MSKYPKGTLDAPSPQWTPLDNELKALGVFGGLNAPSIKKWRELWKPMREWTTFEEYLAMCILEWKAGMRYIHFIGDGSIELRIKDDNPHFR